MQVINVDQNSDEWFNARKGKISGSKLKDIVVLRGKNKKIGFYQLIADRIAIDHDGENVMDRGLRLEDEAIKEFEKRHKLKTKKDGIWVSEHNQNIIISPDRVIDEYSAIEIKCLNSATHIKAHIEEKPPEEYYYQYLQYFIVNEQLKTLWVILYDPRIPSIPFIEFEINRADIQEDIDKFYDYELDILEEVDEWVERLTF
jgi:putative phage-type endonuclease